MHGLISTFQLAKALRLGIKSATQLADEKLKVIRKKRKRYIYVNSAIEVAKKSDWPIDKLLSFVTPIVLVIGDGVNATRYGMEFMFTRNLLRINELVKIEYVPYVFFDMPSDTQEQRNMVMIANRLPGRKIFIFPEDGELPVIAGALCVQHPVNLTLFVDNFVAEDIINGN